MRNWCGGNDHLRDEKSDERRSLKCRGYDARIFREFLAVIYAGDCGAITWTINMFHRSTFRR
jgi:hypothetical protein